MNVTELRRLEQSQLIKMIDDGQLILSRHCDNCKYRKSKCGFLDEIRLRKGELKEIAEECELFEVESEE